jgi:hypothetical protein
MPRQLAVVSGSVRGGETARGGADAGRNAALLVKALSGAQPATRRGNLLSTPGISLALWSLASAGRTGIR